MRLFLFRSLFFIILTVVAVQQPLFAQGSDPNQPSPELEEVDESPIAQSSLMEAVEYPSLARKAQLDGHVLVSILIDTSGNVLKVKIEKSTDTLFSEAAINAVRSVHFIPAKSHGKALKCWWEQPFTFRLKSKEYPDLLESEYDTHLDSTQPVDLNKYELNQYYTLYKSIYVIALRTDLDSAVNALNGDPEGDLFHFPAITPTNLPYFKSKFIVLSMEQSPMGGSWIMILFRDKPDKIFRAWVTDKKSPHVHMFEEAEISPDKVATIAKHFEKLLIDDKHAM